MSRRRSGTSDRRLRWRRVLDGVGQHPDRRPRAARSPAVTHGPRCAFCRPRPVTPTITWCGSTGRSRRRVCEPSHISLFRRETGVGDPRCPPARAQDLIYVGGGSLVSLMGTWGAHGLDEALVCGVAGRGWCCAVAQRDRCAGLTRCVSGFHEGPPATARADLDLLPWSNAVHYTQEAGAARTAFTGRRSRTAWRPGTGWATVRRSISSVPSSAEVVVLAPGCPGVVRARRRRRWGTSSRNSRCVIAERPDLTVAPPICRCSSVR